MKTFTEYLSESKYPSWTRLTAVGLALRVRSLSNEIKNEKDPNKQITLLAQQNNLIAVMSGLGIGIPTADTKLMTRMKQLTVSQTKK